MVNDLLMDSYRQDVTEKLSALIKGAISYSEHNTLSIDPSELPYGPMCNGGSGIGWDICDVCGDIVHQRIYSWVLKAYVIEGERSRRSPSHNTSPNDGCWP